mgnify:CR=1 FL=1
MYKGTILPPAELRKKGFQILVEHLGMANAIRFMGQFQNGSGDYTAERKTLFAGEKIADIAGEIRRQRDK